LAHSVPLDAPLHGPPPARFRDGEVLTFVYRTDRSAIGALVPPPLEPTGDLVMVQIARWGDVPGLGRDTHECNVMVGARFGSGDTSVVGAYSPYFFVDSDRAMAGGREFHGQPKRLATVEITTTGDLHVGRVRRDGIDVFVGTMQYKPRPSTFDALRALVDPVTNLNLKVIPAIDGGSGIRQLTARELADIEVGECWAGPCTAEIRGHATLPLYHLPVREPLDGFYWRTEFSLVGGRVLHDYLAETSEEAR
jgi:acetoacetate decarboxylase